MGKENLSMNKRINCIFDEDKNLLIDENDPEYINKCSFGKISKSKNFIKKFYTPFKFRYLLEYKLNEEAEKNIIIILMNPSYADKNYLDNTLYNVKNFLQNLDKKRIFCKFIILNLFPIRTPNSEKILELMCNYQAQQEKNDSWILKQLDETNDVIVAWGKKYHNVAINKKWFEKLKSKNIYAYGINYENNQKKYGTPKHFSPFAYVYKENSFQDKVLGNYRVKLNKEGYFEKTME